ncbi:hypothetical protein AAFX13_00185 [Vibrio parahaemolyticus]|uniref:hypothetical protein n=1 Tax=Vibrio parahaemolyticus TaxID=670 RepID=UPI00397F6C48
MFQQINSIKNGLSHEVLNLPTFLIQSGFFRKNIEQNGTIYTMTKGETVSLNTVHCNLVIGLPLFSFLLTTQHNLALDKSNEDDEITVKYGKHSKLLKCLKARENHRIRAVEAHLDTFVKYLNPEQKITLNRKSFSIFETLKVNKKDRTITFKISDKFMVELSKRTNPLTYVQNEDLREVQSNGIAGSIFIYTRSISKMKKRYLLKKRIAKMFGIVKNTNQSIDSAFKTLKSKGILVFEKIINYKMSNGFLEVFSKYVITEIKEATVRKIFKEPTYKQSGTIDKSVFDSRLSKSVRAEQDDTPFYLQVFSKLNK